MGKFINPFTDWAFKHIFGREASKDILIEFLNDLLQGERVITNLWFLNNEREPEQLGMRKVIYDIYCQTDTGEHIIVEMQNSQQAFFKDRALYYMAQSIVQQSKKGRGWQFELTAVYGIYFVNFPIDKSEITEHYCKDIAMIDKHTGKVFNNKFRQIYIELPRFMKSEADCNSFLEYWIYNLVNMNNLKEISFKDRKAIFDKLERLASQANLTEEERARLEEDWKNYNDYFNTIDFAKKEGKEEGLAEGEIKKNLENAKKMKDKGYPITDISDITGLPLEEIEKL